MAFSLGNFAGGVADGVETHQNMKNKRAAREALEQETRRKRDAGYREDDALAASAGRPMPGQVVPENYNEDARVEAFNTERAAARAAEANRGPGVLGVIRRAFAPGNPGAMPDRDPASTNRALSTLDAKAAATAAGVTPAPPVVDPAAAAGAIPTQRPDAQLAPGETQVDAVTVEPPRPPQRVWTERDDMLAQMGDARRSGDPDKVKVATRAYYDHEIDQWKKAVPFASVEDLGNIISQVTGQRVEFAQVGEGYTVSVNGQLGHKYVNRAELDGDAMARLSRSPEAGMQLATGARLEHRQSLLVAGQLKALAAAARRGDQASAREARAEGRTETTFQQGQEDRTQMLADLDFVGKAESWVLDPEGATAAAMRLERTLPNATKGYERKTDGDSGDTTSKPNNKIIAEAAAHETAFDALVARNPGKIAIGAGVTGERVFRVVGPDGMSHPARTMAEVESTLRRLYKTQAIPTRPPSQPASRPDADLRRRAQPVQ